MLSVYFSHLVHSVIHYFIYILIVFSSSSIYLHVCAAMCIIHLPISDLFGELFLELRISLRLYVSSID